jgi:hypothetical protein
MTRKKLIDKNDKFGLRLTRAERKLILKGIAHLHEEIAQAIHAASAKQPIMMILDDWKELAGHIAAEADNACATMLQKKLDTTFSKIQDLLETHTDEKAASSPKRKDTRKEKALAKESVQLAGWAAKILIAAERLGIKSKPIARFPVPRAERVILMRLPIISAKLHEKLAAKDPKLTAGDVANLLIAVAEALPNASPSQQFALILTAKTLKDCLESEVPIAVKPAPGGGNQGDDSSKSRSR